MGHDHHHHNHHSVKNLKLAFFLNLFFSIVEIIGGLFVNSVSILSDAIHDLGDSLALGTAWFLEIKSRKKADANFSFGYGRFSLLGALINSVVLIVGSIFIINEAIQRLIHPEESNATGMIMLAALGIIINGFAAYRLSSGKTLNEKVVSWHLMEDVLGWVAVLIVAVILLFKNIPYLDPALSLAITAYILYGVIKRLRETLYLFLQGVPQNINLKEIQDKILEVKHVESLHHTHVWSLEGEKHVFTTHVKLENITDPQQIIETKSIIKQVLSAYTFSHFTVETELDNEHCKVEPHGHMEKEPGQI